MATIGSRRGRRGGRGAVFCSLAAAAVALSGCWKSLLQQPVSASGGAWSIDIAGVRDGPNEYGWHNTRFVPEKGQRFLWVILDLTNTTAQKRRFNWDRCDLDSDTGAHLPSLVVQPTGALNDEADVVEPGQKLSRILVFSFPEERLPTRLACGEMVAPLELTREAP